MGKTYNPGQRVPETGIYRVEHAPHRLMHEATLFAGTQFPRCRQCGNAVAFALVRSVQRNNTVPFRSGSILEEFPAGPKRLSAKKA